MSLPSFLKNQDYIFQDKSASISCISSFFDKVLIVGRKLIGWIGYSDKVTD